MQEPDVGHLLTKAEIDWLADCKRAGFDPVLEIQKLRSQITVAKPSIDKAVIALSRFSVTEQAWHSLGVEQRALVSRVYDAVVKAQEALMSEDEKEALRGV